MKVKSFEIRDKGTFIPALAVLMKPTPIEDLDHNTDSAEAERFLLARAGYGVRPGEEDAHVMLVRMDADGGQGQASYDPFNWGSARTMTVAHQHIEAHWNELESGAVICVERILGERETPKVSERIA